MRRLGHKEGAWYFLWSILLGGATTAITYRRDPVGLAAGMVLVLAATVLLFLPWLLQVSAPVARGLGLMTAVLAPAACLIAMARNRGIYLTAGLSLAAVFTVTAYAAAVQARRTGGPASPTLVPFLAAFCGAVLGGALVGGWILVTGTLTESALFSTYTRSQIQAYIDRMPLGMKSDAARDFVNAHVRWTCTLYGETEQSGKKWVLRLDCRDSSQDHPGLVAAIVRRAPGMRLLDCGDRLTVTGFIVENDDPQVVALKPATYRMSGQPKETHVCHP